MSIRTGLEAIWMMNQLETCLFSQVAWNWWHFGEKLL